MKIILKNLKKYQRFLVAAHVNPDPDALCSQLAMSEFLSQMGKKSIIVQEEALPERLKMFPGVNKVKSVDQVKSLAYDAAIILDCGDRKRVGRVADLLHDGKPIFNIDHHITNKGFGDFNLVKPKASSTAEMLFELFRVGGGRLTKKMAINLYSGLMTDTGCFRYDNTTARTHSIAAELMAFDIRPALLYQQIYETIPLTDLKMFNQVINSFRVYSDGQIVLVELRRKTVEGFSKAFDLRDAIFKHLRPIQGIKVIIIFTEKSSKETRINFRSSGAFNVAKLANHFDGGGHKNASGCLITAPLAEARKRVLAQVAEGL